jgi:MFS family permease
VGLSIGPTVGGMLIDLLGWRWVFFIAVPFGLVGMLLGWLLLPRTTDLAARPGQPVREGFDWLGAALLGPLVGLILAALTFGNSWGWTSPRLQLLGFAALACLVAFLWNEVHVPSPLVDLTFFTSRQFSLGILAGLAAYAVLFGCLFLVPFYLERVLGHTASETGLLLSPVPIALAIIAPLAGALTDRVGPRLPTTLGMAIAAVGLLSLALVPMPKLLVTLPILAMLGAGLGLFTPPNNSSIMRVAPRERLGTAGGVLNMTRSIGTSLGVAMTGAVLALLLSEALGQPVASTVDAPPAQLYLALRGSLLFLAALAAVAAGLSAARGGPAEQALPAHAPAIPEAMGV